MKLTKYEHSCMVVEEQGSRLIIDPGDFSVSLPILDNVVAIVITHVHFDHFNKDRVQSLLAANPDVRIFSVAAVQEQISKAVIPGQNEKQTVGPFQLEFFTGQHAVVHEDYPKFENLGVLINEVFYYGGDSLAVTDIKTKILAIPASSPWAKTGEVMDYLAQMHPEKAFPVHDALNSEAGNAVVDRWFQMHSEKFGIVYKRLATGESLEI